MGSYWSTATKSSITSDITPVLEYLCGKSDNTLSVDPNVKLYVRSSKLPSAFIEGKHKGLFTRGFIAKGTTILSVEQNTDSKMNDGAVDLEPILRADTSEKTYQAWTNLKDKYYDVEKIKKVVNVRMVVDNNGEYYEAIQDIPENGELVRVYGFTTWTLELFDILTNKNIVGFAHFIDDLSKSSSGDPYEARINTLRKALESYDKNIFTTNRIEYDDLMKDETLVYVGKKIQELYMISGLLTQGK